MRKNSTSKITQNSYGAPSHTHLVEFVPEETRTKYTEVVTVSERGVARLTSAFDHAIAAAKKAVDDAAAARAAHAAALAQHGQQQHTFAVQKLNALCVESATNMRQHEKAVEREATPVSDSITGKSPVLVSAPLAGSAT